MLDRPEVRLALELRDAQDPHVVRKAIELAGLVVAGASEAVSDAHEDGGARSFTE